MIAPTAEFVRILREPMRYIKVVPQAQRSQADVLNEAIVRDVPFLGASLFLIIIFFLVGLFRYDKTRSKVTLGVTGVLTVLFTIGATFGLFGWGQITNYPGAFFVYFMLLTLSINHQYLFIHAVNRHASVFALDERLGTITGEILPSVFLSNICPFVPLLVIYISTDILAMKSVSFAGFVGLLLEFFFTATWFVPCVYYDSFRNRVGDSKIVKQYSSVDINACMYFSRALSPKDTKQNQTKTKQKPIASQNFDAQKSPNETTKLLDSEGKGPVQPPRLLRRVSSIREPTLLHVNFLDNSNSFSKFYKHFVFHPLVSVIIVTLFIH